jgi:hypothetical protein
MMASKCFRFVFNYFKGDYKPYFTYFRLRLKAKRLSTHYFVIRFDRLLCFSCMINITKDWCNKDSFFTISVRPFFKFSLNK